MKINIANMIVILIIILVITLIIFHINRKNKLYEKYDLIDENSNVTQNKQKKVKINVNKQNNNELTPANNIPEYEERNNKNNFQNTSTYMINMADMAKAQITNNNFTNNLIDLFDNEQNVKPDGESDENISDNIIIKTDDKFYEKLFSSNQELSNTFLSQRTFVTKPITRIANQQQEFAEWLYGGSKPHEGPNICKTDQSKCLEYEDLRLSHRNY